MDHNDLRDPGAEWRAKPFWALNDDLDTDEIRFQISKFKEMGFGGYFMHSRVGLKTHFLSEQWFEMIAAGIDEGKKTGLETWLYDEDRFPSGTAGGQVTLDHRHRCKQLNCLRTKADSVPKNAIAVFTYCLSDGQLTSYQIADADALNNDADVLAFYVSVGYAGDASIGMYNGMTYIDTLSKQAVARFIELGYEPYLRFAGEFGAGVKGIFTDEPNRSFFLGSTKGSLWERGGSNYQIPWTTNFENEFSERKGYDLIRRLPEVFFNLEGEKRSKARYDTAEVTAQLFTEAYIGQVSEWCGGHGLALTGHYYGEDNLFIINAFAGVVDRFYEPMQVPGADLTEARVEFIVPKQAQSSARQFGKKWVMCEMYAGSGWGYSLQQYKAYGEWSTVFGINLRCPHMSHYSLAGLRKRDYPPSISYHQAWHKDYKAVEDHFARLGIAVTNGDPLCTLLVVHPVDASPGVLLPGWLEGKPGSGHELLARYNNAFRSFTRSLMGLQIDFDVSEEAIIEKHGRVEATNGKAAFVIGRMRYDCVAVPPLVSMRPDVAGLLMDFSEHGGRVVFIGEPVGVIDFEGDPRFIGYPVADNNTASVSAAFSGYGTASLAGPGAFDVLAMHRRDGGCDTLLLVNSNTSDPFDGSARVKSRGQVQHFDTLTCERREVPSTETDGWMEFTVHISKGGCLLLFIKQTPEELPALERGKYTELPCAGGPYVVELDSPNILLLDRPAYRIDGGPQGAAHILQADVKARDYMGFERRGNNMYQPWFRRAHLGGVKRGCLVELEYTFRVDHIPENELYLCLEQPGRHDLSINGSALDQQDCGYYIDKSIRKLKIAGSMLRRGANLVNSACHFDEETDLEAMYLLGDFGVEINGFTNVITAPVHQLELGDITTQGLPYYSGSVKYHMSAPSPGMLRADGFNGIALRLHEPGSAPRLLPFEPYEARLDSTAFALELICTVGNALGAQRPSVNGSPLEPQGIIKCPRVLV